MCTEVKYLGHIITDSFKDNDDILRQRRVLYGQANMLKKNFFMCSVEVKIQLFRSYCTPLYTSQLWWDYTKTSYQKLNVAYNDALRILLNIPRYTSASHMFVSCDLPTLDALRRNLIFSFVKRLDISENSLVKELVNQNNSDIRLTSRIWKHWLSCLYMNFKCQ